MKPGGGGPKGGRYERKVCKKLSLWVTQGARTDVLWRSATSGGRRKLVRGEERKQSVDQGDIVAIDPLGNVLTRLFCIEAKHVKNVGFETCLFQPEANKAIFTKCWEQTVEQAREKTAQLRTTGQRAAPVAPLMCMHVNQRREILVTSVAGWEILESLGIDAPILSWHWMDAHVWMLDDVLMTDFRKIRRVHE